MRAFCPACHEDNPRPAATSDAPCRTCGSALLVAGRYALCEPRPAEQGVDVADGAAPMWKGLDVTTERAVIVRLAASAEAERLRREATVLRGLDHARVPKVLALEPVEGVGLALVVTRPPGRSLENALLEGLRTDAARARRFLEQALELLVYLHGLSPPVFHRNVEPRAIFVEADGRLHLCDFARATDVVEDAEADRVVARPGHTPPADASPAKADLYALGATALHLLSRTPVERLPHKEGRPDFRVAVQIDEPLAHFLERLLLVERREPFESAAEALAELRAEFRPAAPPARSRALPVVLGASVGLLTMMGVGAYLVTSLPPPPSPVVVLKEMEPTPSAAKAPAKDDDGVAPPSRQDPPPRPPKPTPRAQPSRATPPRLPQVSDEHASFLRALKRAVEAHEEALVACGASGGDRVRFTLAIDERGRLAGIEPVGAKGAPTTRCAEDVLRGLDAPKPRSKTVKADVWVWLRPSFRVAAY